MGFRFLWPADAVRSELVFPMWRQLRGMGVRLEVDQNVPVLQTDWDAGAFVGAHTLGTAVEEGTILNDEPLAPAEDGSGAARSPPADGGSEAAGPSGQRGVVEPVPAEGGADHPAGQPDAA
eukprot:11195399-Alexandrium_andersonii.AAC.1